MGAADRDPDPRRQVPSFLYLMLGLIMAGLFAVGVVLVGARHPKAVGPSAGSPADAAAQPGSLAH